MIVRICLAASVTIVSFALTETARAGTLGTDMAKFLESKRGVRVGGGECAHIATEALRVAGGEFIRDKDYPNAGDYDWGRLVKKVECSNGRWKDSSPSSRVQVGDILQYRDATIDYGSSRRSAAHHTSVVAAVSNGMPTEVYEQNTGKLQSSGGPRRYVIRNPIDLKKLTQGWIRIYRPVTRSDAPNQYKFTIVNNTDASIVVARKVGNSVDPSISLLKVNTSGSFKTSSQSTGSSSSRIVLSVDRGASSVTVSNAKGYEVYKVNGSAKIRAINP